MKNTLFFPLFILLLFLASFGTVTTTANAVLQFDYNEIKREITLGDMGGIHLSDSYLITSKENNLDKIEVYLPQGAYNVSAHDTMGSLNVVSKEKDKTTFTNATVTLRITLRDGDAGRFSVSYKLPRENYIIQNSWSEFNLTFNFIERFNWTIGKLTVSVTLPEGATFVSSSVDPDTFSFKRIFQEVILFTHHNVTPIQDLGFTISYKHHVFWASFRPTLWMGVLVAIVSPIILLRRSTTPLEPVTPLQSGIIRRFVDVYEDKRRLLSQLRSLEQRSRKGRMPRRSYRVRRKTLEGRLSAVSRDLTDLREKLRTASLRYADAMGRIEVAETELDGVEEDIKRVETRYRSREISSETYRKLLEEYHRRRERAETTIDGVLLRLREEIR